VDPKQCGLLFYCWNVNLI